MNLISNKSAKIIGWLNGITFTVFYIINEVLQNAVYPMMREKIDTLWITIFITAVISAVLYAGLFLFIKFLYKFFVFKIKCKKCDINGKWYHLHIPYTFDGVDYSKNCVRAGETCIKHELFDFTFVGTNYSYIKNKGDGFAVDTSNTTHWRTRATKFCEENDFDIIQIYEAKTKKNTKIKLEICPCCMTSFTEKKEICEASEFRHGIHKLRLITNSKGKCYKIEGEYSDSWPSMKRGDIIYFRNEEDRNKEIENYFARALLYKKPSNDDNMSVQ